MTVILALDLGGTTGWALGKAQACVAMGRWRAPTLTASKRRAGVVMHPGEVFDSFTRWLLPLLREHAVEIVAFEEAYHDSRKRGPAAARLLYGYRAMTSLCAYRVGARLWPVEPTRVKIEACGWLSRKDPHGRREWAKGAHVLAAVQAREPAVEDEHVAIARTVFALAARDCADGAPVTPS